MAIVRVIKDKSNPYVMLNKTCLCDEKLSWKAKGLHSYLLSLPDDWKIYIEDLKNRSKDGKGATSSAIKELINAGYIKRIAKRDSETNRFIGGFEYEVYEIPIDIVNLPKDSKSRESKNPETGKPDNREKREPGNPSLLNNELILNNKLKVSKYVSEEDNNLSLISKIYQDNVGPIYPASTEWIIEVSEKFEVDLFKRAVEICIDKSNVTQGYLKGILKKWDAQGIFTLEALKAKEIEFYNKKSSKKKNNYENKNYENKKDYDESEDIDPELLAELKRQEELLGLS